MSKSYGGIMECGGIMDIERQKTLKNPIHCSGIGLHSGEKILMSLRPAPAGTGILFRRTDAAGGGAEIRATWENATETPLCTTIVAENGARIATIEHLMAALSGCGIDNVIVELDGAEVPVMDGSAAPFVFLIDCAGSVAQDAPRRALRVLKTLTVEDPDRRASLSPSDDFSIRFEIDFENQVVARQEWHTAGDTETFKREISRARTFGFLHEVDRLRANGLARGGSLDNAVVISGDKVLNAAGLRFGNEFVRHKVLDSIGDLFLLGAPLVGHFHGVRAGHSLTLRLVRALMDDPSAWEWVEMPEAGANGRPLFHGASIPPIRAVAARA